MLKDYKGKIAVITGAAGGIGRGLAEKAVSEGMKVVLADVEVSALGKTEDYLRSKGGDVFTVVTDVSKADQVQQLAELMIKKYGTIDLLCNNAGVAAGGLIKEHTLADWQWVLGVNLWGVIYGIHSFLPLMMKKTTDCHIVNTASVEGLWARMGSACYQASKHAVVAISEVLKMELASEGAKVGVSVLCPGGVNTGILEAERNRPANLQNAQIAPTPEQIKFLEQMKQVFASSMSPLVVADHVFEAIAKDRFYILTHPELNPLIQARLGRILTDGIPQNPLASITEEQWRQTLGLTSTTMKEFASVKHGFMFKYDATWTELMSENGELITSLASPAFKCPGLLLTKKLNATADNLEGLLESFIRMIGGKDLKIEKSEPMTNGNGMKATAITFKIRSNDGSMLEAKAYGVTREDTWFVMTLYQAPILGTLEGIKPDEVFGTWQFTK